MYFHNHLDTWYDCEQPQPTEFKLCLPAFLQNLLLATGATSVLKTPLQALEGAQSHLIGVSLGMRSQSLV